jgi:uncharacterized protein with ParB-like and HNH nuclease domain
MNNKFSTTDIPQADKLEKVIATIEAVNEGATKEIQIAETIGFSSRQARYYRHAAEVLGFIINNNNYAIVTELGKTFANGSREEQVRLLKRAIFENNLFSTIIGYFEKSQNGFTETQAEDFLLSISDNEASATIPRRIKTILSWLEYVEIIIEQDDKFTFNDKFDQDLENKLSDENEFPATNYTQEVDIKEERFSVFELLRKIKQNKVIMNPDFQRNLVWKPYQKSQFIESIILNVPLPPLYFRKELNGEYIIVDGLQRTSALKAFLSEEPKEQFALDGLLALPDLNQVKFKGLDDDIKTRIEDKNLLIYVLQPSVPMEVVYDIFNRINTGGTKLERQEIRNCIFIGQATTLLKKLSELANFKIAIDYGISPIRMKDREAILRCLAFVIFDYEADYNNSMDEFLEKAMKRINRMSELEIGKLESNFNRVMTMSYDFFKEHNFRFPTSNGRGRINIAIMETVYNFFATTTDEFLKANKNKIIKNYNVLLMDIEYMQSVRYSTGTTSKVKSRFTLAKQILGKL